MTQTSASSEKQIRAAKERQQRDSEIEGEIIRVLAANPEGRRWLWNQIGACRVFQIEETLDPQVLAHNAGLRSHGLRLFASIGLHAAKFIPTMMEENSSTIKKAQDDDDRSDS